MMIAFLYASLACALVAVPLWLALEAALRRWPALSMSRSVWLLAQAVILAALLLALAPQRAEFSLLPPIELARTATAGDQRAPALADAILSAAAPAMPQRDQPASPGWLTLMARAWFAVYCTGLLAAAVRYAAGRRALALLLKGARRLDEAELDAHPAFADAAVRARLGQRLPVWETAAAVSPMLAGLLRPCLLLPQHLRSFSPPQQQLIVAHEMTHLRRRDPLWLHVSIAIEALLWFNPAMRRLGQRFHWAQELGCDRQVLHGRAANERQQYAAALVAQLKLQRGVAPALAFGNADASSLAARIGLIRLAERRCGVAAKAGVAVLLSGVLIGSALLQPAFAWRAPLTAALVSPVQSPAWRAPLAQVRVTSFFGVPRQGLPAGHGGIDFAARTGSAVLATADGVVVESSDLRQGEANYGKLVVIEHAHGLRSLYAHLSQRAVSVGQAVMAGQQIGLSGATGKATGPHLHLEAFEDGRKIDPARLIPDLERHASPKALAARGPG